MNLGFYHLNYKSFCNEQIQNSKLCFIKMEMATLCHKWNCSLDKGSNAWIKALLAL